MPIGPIQTTESEFDVPHFSTTNPPSWAPLPEYGGSQAILYSSPDGTRVAGTYRESGQFTFEYPADEFVYVIAGHATASVRGGKVIELKPGDLAYFREGLVVDFDMSDDFHDATMFVGSAPVEF